MANQARTRNAPKDRKRMAAVAAEAIRRRILLLHDHLNNIPVKCTEDTGVDMVDQECLLMVNMEIIHPRLMDRMVVQECMVDRHHQREEDTLRLRNEVDRIMVVVIPTDDTALHPMPKRAKRMDMRPTVVPEMVVDGDTRLIIQEDIHSNGSRDPMDIIHHHPDTVDITCREDPVAPCTEDPTEAIPKGLLLPRGDHPRQRPAVAIHRHPCHLNSKDQHPNSQCHLPPSHTALRV